MWRSRAAQAASYRWFWFPWVGRELQSTDSYAELKIPVPTRNLRAALAEVQEQNDFDILDCAVFRYVNRGQPFDGLASFWGKFLSDLEIYLALGAEEYWTRIRTHRDSHGSHVDEEWLKYVAEKENQKAR